MPHASKNETEVKIKIPSTAEWQSRLEAAGFRAVAPAQPEHSILWDRGADLFSKGQALRLRRYGSTSTLTWKGSKIEHPTLKIRPEIETSLGAPEAMEGILQELGFKPVMRMEKIRSMLERPGLVACLDETPFGCFMELEGDAEAIQDALAELGLRHAQVETRSYPTLFREHGLG
jgi:adenylate cyclase class 2